MAAWAEQRPRPLYGALWKLGRTLLWPLRPLEYLFRIREDLGLVGKLSLLALFLSSLFGFWCWASNSPEWLNQWIEQLYPQFKVQARDSISMGLERSTRTVHLQRAGVSREVVFDLPDIAPSALPAFNPENYPAVFAEIRGFGLDDFVAKDARSYGAKVVDLAKAKSSGGFDPLPFRMPVAVGEGVTFNLDSLRGRLTVSLQRDSLRKAMVPYKGDPKRLDEAVLAGLASERGISTTFKRKDELSIQGTVADVEKFRAATQLGPSEPIQPLQLGEELTITFKPEELTALVEMGRTQKQRSVGITSAVLAPAALPDLTVEAFPGLFSELTRRGLTVELKAEADHPNEPYTIVVADVGKAVNAGFGLFRPREARIVNPMALPSPAEVADGWPVLWHERNLMGGFHIKAQWPFVSDFDWKRFQESALYTSLKRVWIGFGMAVLIALPLGILMGAFTKFYYFFEPIRIAGLYLPLPAFVPLTMVWAGIGEDQKYLFLFVCNFVVLLPYTVVAIQSVPQVYLDTAATLGLSRPQILRRVLIGVAKPELWKALRFTFGVGWTWIILAEQIGVDNGLGYLIWTSEKRSHPDHVYIVILLIMLLAFVINSLWTALIQALFPHERSR